MSPTFTTRVRVRFGETDKMGIVYHPNYIVYFELGRTEWMRAQGICYAEMEREGMSLAVVDVGIHYHASARYDEELLIETKLTQATGVRLRFEYQIRKASDDALLSVGHTILGCVGDNGRPKRIESPWLEQIKALLDPTT